MKTKITFVCKNCITVNNKELFLGSTYPKKIVQRCDNCKTKISLTIIK